MAIVENTFVNKNKLALYQPQCHRTFKMKMKKALEMSISTFPVFISQEIWVLLNYDSSFI